MMVKDGMAAIAGRRRGRPPSYGRTRAWSGWVLFLFLLSPPSQTLLAQTDPVKLDTLRVQVGSRASDGILALTRSVAVVTREDVDALPVRSIAEVLGWITGVEIQARSPAQSDLSIRGGGFEQVVVLVNGVRMSDPQTGHFDLNLTVPLDRVERIEILRGPASALYGADAVGGVVNIVTRDGPGGLHGRVEGGSWGSARVSLGTSHPLGNGGVVGLGGELGRSDGHRLGTDFDEALAHVQVGYPAGSGRLSGEFGMAGRDFGAQDFYASYPSFEKTRTLTSSLRWSRDPSAAAGFTVGTSFRRHQDEFTLVREDPDLYQNRHTSSQAGLETLFRRRLSPGIRLALGGEVFLDVLRSNALGDREESRGALFGEAVLGGSGPLILAAGIRQDVHEVFGAVFSPSISGSFRAGSGVRLRASVGRSYRAPTWTERFYKDPLNVGRDDLEPERAWSADLGMDAAASPDVRLSVTAFLRRSRDLIDWARPSEADSGVPWETRNVENATFRGIELDLSLRDPLGLRWILGGSILGVTSEERPGFVSKYVLRPLVQQTKLGVSRTIGESLDLGLQVQRARRRKEDPYHRIGFRGTLRVGGFRVYLDGENLLDASYPDVTGNEAPGRAVFLGLEMGAG